MASWQENVDRLVQAVEDSEGAEEAQEFRKELEADTSVTGLLTEYPIVTEADVEAAKTSARARVYGPSGAGWLEIVQSVQDDSITDESTFKEYLRTTFRDTNQKYLRDFAWDVYGILTSKASLPDLSYRPQRDGANTVRFVLGRTDRFGVNVAASGTQWDKDKQTFVLSGETSAALWVKVIDGWSKDGNWGGYLQITCATAKGQWIDSTDGWVRPQTSKGDPVTFYDMGPYYEIWQKDRETGRPLVVDGGTLRFVNGATPTRWNLQDSTWD